MTGRLIGFCLALVLAGACAGVAPTDGPPGGPADTPSGIEDDFRAAGMFAFTRHEGTVKVLLGLDAHTDRWADFVGYRESGETAVQTAIREFTEETRGAYATEVGPTDLTSSSSGPHRVGPVRIFLIEIPYKEPDLLAGLTVSTYAEKTHYCWVDLQVLLESVDSSGNGTSVPPHCDRPGVDGRLRVRNETAANLRAGGVLRGPLEGLSRP